MPFPNQQSWPQGGPGGMPAVPQGYPIPPFRPPPAPPMSGQDPFGLPPPSPPDIQMQRNLGSPPQPGPMQQFPPMSELTQNVSLQGLARMATDPYGPGGSRNRNITPEEAGPSGVGTSTPANFLRPIVDQPQRAR